MSRQKPIGPGEEWGGGRILKPWEFPGVSASLARRIQREGWAEVSGKKLPLDQNGYVRIGAGKYMVLTGIKSPVVNVETPRGLNVLFDDNCTDAGIVDIHGGCYISGRLAVKTMAADRIRYVNGLSAFGEIIAKETDIEGRGFIEAAEIKARGSINVAGDAKADVIMANTGAVMAHTLTGKKILGYTGVYSTVGGISYDVETIGDEAPECLIWCNEGGISSQGTIRTGSVCAGKDINTFKGDLVIEGDAYCMGARIRGRVTDGSGKDASESVYSRCVWECHDEAGRMTRKKAKNIPAKKHLRTPFDVRRWKEYWGHEDLM